jgi:hypothetical protein
MTTPLEHNPEFNHFTNYMGVKVSVTNLQIYTDLYFNFVNWPSPNPTYSFAEKFITWKRFYDEYKETQEQIINANLFATPPTDPRTLNPVNTSLPQDLEQLNTSSFQHFILENNPEPPQTPTNSCTDYSKDSSQNLEQTTIMDNLETINNIAAEHVEIIEEVLQQSNPANPSNDPNTSDDNMQSEPIPHTSNPTPLIPQILPPYTSNFYRSGKKIPTQGKNITQMKEIYGKKKSRKRKASPQDEIINPTVIVGPGRPTKDEGLLRDAKLVENSADDEANYAFREVHLLSSNGSIRKKTRLLTKQNDRNLRCLAIKHFNSLEYIAEKKTKAFAIIKRERQKIKTLNYLELNTITDMKAINTPM